MINQVILVGHVGKKPEFRSTPSGVSHVKFSVATNKRWQDKTGKWTEDTQWHSCNAWGAKADYLLPKLNKGTLVYVEGEIQYQKWTDKTGQEKYFTVINTNTVKILEKTESKKASERFEDPSPDALVNEHGTPQDFFDNDSVPF